MGAYFDNAATTYPKPESVYTFMDQFYRENGGNAGRGQYTEIICRIKPVYNFKAAE